ncbi:unnamed protein product [Malus baccata var. baccata]
MGDPLGSSRMSSQKQNREGVVGAQSGQYRTTAESSPGCGGGSGWDMSFRSSLASGSVGTSKLSEFARKQSYDG